MCILNRRYKFQEKRNTMDRNEFMDKLQHTLAGGLNSYQVADNVRYYQEYIDGEIRKGKSEEEVLAPLGDPRLLAKSIIEANKRAGASEGVNGIYDEEVVSEEGDGTHSDAEGERRTKMTRIPGWVIVLLGIVVVVLVFVIGISLFSVFWPFILALMAVAMIGKFWRQRK